MSQSSLNIIYCLYNQFINTLLAEMSTQKYFSRIGHRYWILFAPLLLSQNDILIIQSD